MKINILSVQVKSGNRKLHMVVFWGADGQGGGNSPPGPIWTHHASVLYYVEGPEIACFLYIDSETDMPASSTSDEI